MSITALVRELAERIEMRPLPVSPVVIDVGEDDGPAPALDDRAKLGHAEGQTFVIDYVDSAGRASTRRITVWAIVEGAQGIPSLVAHCHERRAQRQFRIDRIRAFIDFDGEVFEDIPAFMAQNFAMDSAVASRKDNRDAQRWIKISRWIKHDAVLLAALSRVDGATVPVETDAATNYLAWSVERDGMMLDDAEILEIYRYVNRLRPTELALMRSLSHVSLYTPEQIRRLLIAAAAVVDADGQRHPAEIAMINAISNDLIGVSMF